MPMDTEMIERPTNQPSDKPTIHQTNKNQALSVELLLRTKRIAGM
jgi:hypothetical protein